MSNGLPRKSVRCFCITVLIVMTGAGILSAQWMKQSPVPTDKTITDICFINSDTGWIFGFTGTIFRTNDGGDTWIDQSLNITNDVEVGLFLDENQGWLGLYGDYSHSFGEIYATTDGGFNWELQFHDQTCEIRDLSFINTNTGWALAHYCQTYPSTKCQNFFLKTTDGGVNWFVLDSIEQYYFNRMDFINDTLGFIAGAGNPNLMKTLDGGMTWQTSPHVSNAGLTDVFFTDVNNGYSCGNNFYFTHNSGAGWSSTYCYYSYKVDMYDEFNGWTISFDKVYKVTNGGQNADYQFTFDKSVLADISVVDSSNAIVAGKDVCIYATKDAGQSWHEKSSGATENLHSVFFLDENNGWAGGEGHTLLITHDGGKYWKYIDIGSDDDPVTDIQFTGPGTGFLVNGYILRSTDSGATWNVTSGFTNPVFDLYFIDSLQGWSVGADGRLFMTMNGGIDWEGQNSGTDIDLNAVYFTDKNSGWIAGDGIVKKTTDGGDTWVESYVSDAEFLKIQFFGESVGYILADRYYIKTYTGGQSWQVVIPEGMSGPYSLEGLCFIDQDTGYLSGSYYLLKTTDGGAGWYSIPGMPDMEANAIFFTDELKGWIVGDHGIIYKTETGGFVSVNDHGGSANSLFYDIFPNPSRDNIRITYVLESAEDVEIGIYTLQGTRISYNKETGKNPGSYSYDWDPGNLPSGIYLCKIKIGVHSDTEKMVYIK